MPSTPQKQAVEFPKHVTGGAGATSGAELHATPTRKTKARPRIIGRAYRNADAWRKPSYAGLPSPARCAQVIAYEHALDGNSHGRRHCVRVRRRHDRGADSGVPSGLAIEAYRDNGVVSQFERSHDTQLDMDCQFVVLADGKLHCAPMVTTNGVYFADAACTEGLAPRGKKYQLRTPVGAACGTPDVIEIDNAATALVAYESNGSKCTPVAAKTESYVRVKRVVPPSELVGGTKTSQPRGPQLLMSMIEGDDGSRCPLGIVDSGDIVGPCESWMTPDGVLRCVPVNTAFHGGQFGDANGTVPVGTVGFRTSACDAPPLVVGEAHGPFCQRTLSFSAARPKVTGNVYQGDPQHCIDSSSIFSNTYYPLGKPISDDAFASLRLVLGAETPLALAAAEVDSGETLDAIGFWDSVHHTPCRPDISTDGKIRCVPPSAAFSIDFADPQCTLPVVTMGRGDCGSTRHFQAWLRRDANGNPTGKLSYYVIGPIVPSSLVYSLPPAGGCRGSAASSFEVHSLQDITHELVELHEVME